MERTRFTGHERDLGMRDAAGDDLDFMHARSYCPALGRFTGMDPGPFDLSRPQSLNRMAYAYSNPLRFVDPTGEVISLSDLTDDQIHDLLFQLNIFTGNTYDVDEDGNLVLVAEGPDAQAQPRRTS